MNELLLHEEDIASHIYFIRGQKVMLDSDLAQIYGVETRRLNEQVRRNEKRFPKDFMFQLTEVEWENLMSQNATSSLRSQNATLKTDKKNLRSQIVTSSWGG